MPLLMFDEKGNTLFSIMFVTPQAPMCEYWEPFCLSAALNMATAKLAASS